MAYKKFAHYFKWIDQIVYEIIANLFTHSFLSASFTHLNPFNSLPSNYQTHCFHNISNHGNCFLLILKACLQKKNCLYIYREKEYSIKKSINELV